MKIYKFGGASVRNAEGVRNLTNIVSQSGDDIVVVVSAMGKTTNALERVAEALWNNDINKAESEWRDVLSYHVDIIRDLNLSLAIENWVSWEQLKAYVRTDYDELYDQVVSCGEIISTHIISAYLNAKGIDNSWLYIPDVLRTDATFRDAKVDMADTQSLLREQVIGKRVVVTQGFLGGTKDGRRTTLGREGSDYTAAILGNLLDAESVTIWKDVPGILNADPRLMDNTVLIPELTYYDAVELSYSGAQIIHPKTIRPLENKQIPLYVRPFGDITAKGSVIHATTAHPIDVPVYIWRKNQILITVRPKDFAFVLEESLTHIFDIIERNHLKVSLIQSSAVTISVCVDNTRYVAQALQQLAEDFRVTYNENLSLLTIRGTSPEILEQESRNRTILLRQLTRRTARLVIQNVDN
ncbi:MAG: aspartate kinase [Paludibacteraceae bacterium]|nr:aspartate kinase [Paludibacteraceae bacterium]